LKVLYRPTRASKPARGKAIMPMRTKLLGFCDAMGYLLSVGSTIPDPRARFTHERPAGGARLG
jgi:hypothetical protein